MTLIADILMVAGTFCVAIYCAVLARRLNRFTGLEKGVGGAIAILSAQVDDMTKTLNRAQKTAVGSAARLEQLTERSEAAAKRLELLIASMHDIPSHDAPSEPQSTQAPQQAPIEKPVTEDVAVEEDDASEHTVFLSQRSRAEAAE